MNPECDMVTEHLLCVCVCQSHPLMNVLDAHQVAVLLQTESISLQPLLCIG